MSYWQHAELASRRSCFLFRLAAVGDVLYDADQLDWHPGRVGEDVPYHEDPALRAVRVHDPVLELVAALFVGRSPRAPRLTHTLEIVRVHSVRSSPRVSGSERSAVPKIRNASLVQISGPS